MTKRFLCTLLYTLTALFAPMFVAPNAFAQATCNSSTIPLCQVPGTTGVSISRPIAVPTSVTAVTFADTKIFQVVIASTAAVTITLADRQGTPIPLLAAVAIAAGQTYVIAFPSGYWCPGGVSIIASGAGATVQLNLAQ